MTTTSGFNVDHSHRTETETNTMTVKINFDEPPFNDPDEGIPFMLNLAHAVYGSEAADGWMRSFVEKWLLRHRWDFPSTTAMLLDMGADFDWDEQPPKDPDDETDESDE
jgi:hypothetical protein